MKRRTLIASVVTGAAIAATSAYGVSLAATGDRTVPKSDRALQDRHHNAAPAGLAFHEQMRSTHLRMLRDPAMRQAHRSIAENAQMRRLHSRMMLDPAMRRMHTQMMGASAGMGSTPQGMMGR